MSNVSCFFSEFLGAFLLMLLVLAFGDKNNAPAPAGLAPVALYFLILGIGASWGTETGMQPSIILASAFVLTVDLQCRLRH